MFKNMLSFKAKFLILLQIGALRNMDRKLKYLSGYLKKNQSFHLKISLVTFKLEQKNKTGHVGLYYTCCACTGPSYIYPKPYSFSYI